MSNFNSNKGQNRENKGKGSNRRNSGIKWTGRIILIFTVTIICLTTASSAAGYSLISQPMKPIQPVSPVNPIEPVEPGNPTQPFTPVQPFAPISPITVRPFKPYIPIDIIIRPIWSYLDLSTSKYFPPVIHQHSTNMCVACSVIYYNFGFIEARDNDWNAASGKPEYLLSPLWAYNMANNGTGTGTEAWVLKGILENMGTPTMATVPWDPDTYDPTTWYGEDSWREAPLHRIESLESIDTDYVDEENNPATRVRNILLNKKVPVSFSWSKYNNAQKRIDQDIVTSDELSGINWGDHAQTVVGYDDYKKSPDGEEVGAFKIVNSAGSTYAGDGFFWLTYDAFNELGHHQKGIWYIEDKEDYEPNLLATWEFGPNDAPARDAFIKVTLGSSSSPAMSNSISRTYITKNLEEMLLGEPEEWVVSDLHMDTTNPYPDFMCLDISEFTPYLYDENCHINLHIEERTTGHNAAYHGQLESFTVEKYTQGYGAGKAIQSSPELYNLPKNTPCVVSTYITPMFPIKIDGNNDWDMWVNSGLVSGGGTQANPYRIANYEINDYWYSASGNSHGIEIRNTDRYFEIENVDIHGQTSCGIYLENVKHGYITEVYTHDNTYGIAMLMCDDITVSASAIANNDRYGLYLFLSDDITISINGIGNNDNGGIYSYRSQGSIFWNFITNNGGPGITEYSSDLNIFLNEISGNG